MKMFCVYVIVLILSAGSVLGSSSMPTQELFWTDDRLFNVARDIDAIKTSNENIKVRLEMQQLLNNDLLRTLSRIDAKLNATLSMRDHSEEDKNSVKSGQSQKFSNCAEALMTTQLSGIYNMILRNYRLPFPVYCENNIFGGKWTVIQRRQDGSVDFFRNWTEYKNGFGDLNGEFFIGLDKLHALTAESPQELLIELEDFDNDIRYAKYDAFAIGSGHEDYPLSILGAYSGNVKDSLSYHQGMKFTTKDRDNDKSPSNCANKFKGAWWYNECQASSLNGLYLRGTGSQYGLGVLWYYWRGEYYSLKRVQMLIRPKI